MSCCAPSGSEQLSDGGDKIWQVERLEQGADITREVVDGVDVAARNMDDRQRGIVFPEAVNELSAAHTGHPAVGHHKIKGFSRPADQVPASQTIAGLHDLVPFVPKHPRQQLA